jgi:hypothetical protein
MALSEQHSLLLIFVVAAVAPLLCECGPRIRLPFVMLGISRGILVSPQVLGWAAGGTEPSCSRPSRPLSEATASASPELAQEVSKVSP